MTQEPQPTPDMTPERMEQISERHRDINSWSATPELLPCPFCGGEVTEAQFQGETPWTREPKVWYRTYCVMCDYGMSEPINYEKLVSRWNSRAAHTLTPEQVERARKLIPRLDLCLSATSASQSAIDRAVELLREVVGDE